jgi:glycosyltransferase involved in cell wall biosynthesis
MKIFFLTYWGFNEGLSQSTVIPNLKLLSDSDTIDKVFYFSIERYSSRLEVSNTFNNTKIIHFPFYSKKFGNIIFTKLFDWIRKKDFLSKVVNDNKPDLVICRGAMAGAFGVMLYKKYNIPFVVESFEPHADYMFNSGSWKKNRLRYIVQKKNEKEIKKYAQYIITVSENYKRQLIQSENVEPQKVKVVPCFVNDQLFMFNQEKRVWIRKELGLIESTIVGIYSGKFGGIYYDKEAFKLFKESLDFFKEDFYLIILSPDDKEQIENKLSAVNFPLNQVYIAKVQYHEVTDYLSAADFAFNLHVSSTVSHAFSPIKNGEYWANGLPIIISRNIGDDSEIIQKEGVGAVMNINDSNSIVSALGAINIKIEKQEEYRQLARWTSQKYRDEKIGRKVYEDLIHEFQIELNNTSRE